MAQGGGDTKSYLKLGRMPKREDGWKLLKGKKLLCEKYIKKYKKTKKKYKQYQHFYNFVPNYVSILSFSPE